MGRELKRVSLDFDWPLNKVWKGFINPYYKHCPQDQKNCFNGQTAAGQWVEGLAYFIGMLGDEALKQKHAEELQARGWNYPHPYVKEWAYAPHYDVPRKDSARLREIDDPEEHKRAVNEFFRTYVSKVLPMDEGLATFIEGLAGKPREETFGISDERFSRYQIEKRLLRMAGLKMSWLLCPVCKGEGLDPSVKKKYDAWEKEEPPEGPGYQVWETVSEGSPVSPVFETAEALIDWLSQPGDKYRQGYSREAAEKFVKGSGWAPSAVIINGTLLPNIESAVQMK